MKPELQLSGEDGNVFSILGRARKIARKNSLDWDAIRKETRGKDYWDVINVLEKHFEVG